MQERARYSLSGVLSLITHVLIVLVFAWSMALDDKVVVTEELPDWEIDFIEFDVKELEPDAAQGEPETEPEPEPPAPEEAAPPPVEQPEDPEGEAAPPPPEPDPEPKPRFGDKKSKIGALVPPNATWTLVLANKRIKKLPFRDAATEIMAPLADFRLLVDDAGFNVWEDFEFIVMGSPDATDQTQAFVAVQYRFGHDEMKAGVTRACKKNEVVVDWREEKGVTVGVPRYADPEREAKYPHNRHFLLLPGDKVALYLREPLVEQVIAGPDASKGKTAGNFVANIARIRRFVAAEPKAGVQVIVEDIRSMVASNVKLPFEVPSRAEIMWEAARKPELVVKLDFLETEHAEGAENYWNNGLEQDLRALKQWDGPIGANVPKIEFSRDKRRVTLRFQFTQALAVLTLESVASEFGRAMRWTEEKAKAAQKAREEAWALREDGKRLPSEIFEEPENGSTEPADTTPDGPADTKPNGPTDTEPDAPADTEPDAPEPDAPADTEPDAPEPDAPAPAE